MSVGAIEVSLAAAQLAARWFDYSQRAKAGEMSQSEIDAVWAEITFLSDRQQEEIARRIAEKKGQTI